MLRRTFGIVVFGTTIAGCSGKSEKHEDGGDGGGTAGSSGASGATSGASGSSGAGGTGGSVRPPKLGLYMMIRNPDPNVPEVAGRSCPTSTGVEWDIGEPIVQNGVVVGVDSPRATDFGTTIESGTDDVELRCLVSASGMYQIEGSGTDPQITPPGGLINFVMNGQADRSSGTTVEGLSVYTPLTLDVRTNPGFPPCAMTDVHEVAPGALWADFDCPALTRLGDNTACRVSGTIVVEYCSTE